MLAPVRHAQLHDTGHFLPKTHTARAVNTAAHLLHADERPHVFDGYDTFFFLVTRSRATVTDGQVLQLALTALVANRAI